MSLSQLPPNELIRMGKKGWVFQTPFRYGLTPSVGRTEAYLDHYRGMSASRVHSCDSIFESFIEQASITVCFFAFSLSCGCGAQLKPPRSPTNFLLSTTRLSALGSRRIKLVVIQLLLWRTPTLRRVSSVAAGALKRQHVPCVNGTGRRRSQEKINK